MERRHQARAQPPGADLSELPRPDPRDEGAALLHPRLGRVAESWEAFETLAHRVDELAPALTAPNPPHEVSYIPGTWDPLKGEVPDVQARLIRYPDGRNVLLTANVRRSPVGVTIAVAGLRDEAVRDMFDGAVRLPVTNGAFTDMLEARAVRTYALGQIDGPDRCASR